jgi:hypothetical protein
MGIKSTCVADERLLSHPDEELMAFARANDATLVTADGQMKVRKHERAALVASGISVVEFIFPDRYSMWERFQLMVNKWLEVEARLAEDKYLVARPRSVKSLREERRR